MLQRVLCLTCIIVTMVAIGCGGGGSSGSQPTFSSSGKLTVDDKPFGPATLALASTDSSGKLPSLTGNVAEDGTIKFVTYGQEGVVAAGSYNVTMAGDIMTMKTVPATEPATVEIKSGDKTVDIKLKSVAGAAPVSGLTPPDLAQ